MLLDDNEDLLGGMNLLSDLSYLSLDKDLVNDSQFQVDLDNRLVSNSNMMNVSDGTVDVFLDGDLYLQGFNLLNDVEDLVVNLYDVSLDS